MQSLSAKVFSLLAAICFVLCVALRTIAAVFEPAASWNIVFYVVSFVGVLFIGVATLKDTQNSQAFELKSNKRMTLLSYLCAAGFFAEFVWQAVNTYLTYKGLEYNSILSLIPMLIACVMAIFSSLYFFAIGMSYTDYGYDFKNLKVIHIAPTLWAISSTLGVMSLAISPLKDVNTVVKYIALIFGAVYFLFLAREVESDKPFMKLTAFFSKAFSYFGVIFFFSTVMLVIEHKADLIVLINSIALMLISQFSLFHQRAIND